MSEAYDRAVRLDGEAKARLTEPLGHWRFRIEIHNAERYGVVTFYWPDGEGRERKFAPLLEAANFFSSLNGRTVWETDELERLVKSEKPIKEPLERPEPIERWWDR